jgi:DNA-binding response OmpR family regulator
MTDRPLTLFVVDDDPAARMIVSFELDDPAFRVIEFDNAEACLAALEQRPDVLLLDVEMPGMDGIALCREVRAAGLDQAQVIFISGHDDLDTRLRAYDAGGNDFMVKPYAPAELVRKVRLAERVLEERHGLSSQASYAQQAAFTAMSSMGEMGLVLEFMRQSFSRATPDELAEAVFQALGQYGLHGLLELDADGQARCYSSLGVCSALESSILGHTRCLQRIFQFHDRLAINYPRITLLVLDLPLHDPDRIGRLRDHLAILAEAASARLAAMASESLRLAQSAGIGDAVAELTRALAEVESRQAANRLHSLEASNAYLEELDRAFVHLGLSEGQEAALVDMARKAVARITDLLGEDKSLGDRLRAITLRLEGLSGAARP